jgi:hypothetical protein
MKTTNVIKRIQKILNVVQNSIWGPKTQARSSLLVLSRDNSVGFAPHLLGLWPMCFVVRRLRIWLQYARASRLAHRPNPLRI